MRLCTGFAHCNQDGMADSLLRIVNGVKCPQDGPQSRLSFEHDVFMSDKMSDKSVISNHHSVLAGRRAR